MGDKEFDFNYGNIIIDFPLNIGNINTQTKFSQIKGDKKVILKEFQKQLLRLLMIKLMSVLVDGYAHLMQ